ncbi:MAG: hypothetical protein ACOCZL_00110 [Bacteroidota bacterium]
MFKPELHVKLPANFEGNMERMKPILLIIFGLLLSSAVHSQYIGWGIERIERNVKWECECKIEIVKKDKDKYRIQFFNEQGVTEMVFYMEENGRCFGYSVYCDNNYEKKLRDFIDKNYSYVKNEDFYENRRSYLFYQSDKKKKIIHVITKKATSEKAKPF